MCHGPPGRLPSMTRSRTQSGFTLVEMLVALAIVALSFAVLFKVISDGLDRTHRAREEVLAAAHAQSLLAQWEAAASRPGISSGKFADGILWSVAVEPYADGQERRDWPVGAVRIAATVSWRDGGQIRSRTLATLRVVPKAVTP